MLDKRLSKICELARSEVVADIGADHGLVSAYLLKNNLCSFAYVTDISKQSLDKARVLFKNLKITDMAQFLAGDGLTVLPYLPNACAVIAGMGGNEIIKILDDKKRSDGISCFVLAPQNNTIKLRNFLIKSGYKIVFDIMIEQSGQYYNIIKTAAGKDNLNELELTFGRTNLVERGEDFVEFIKSEFIKFKEISKSLKTKDTKVHKYVKLLKLTNIKIEDKLC